VEVKAELCREKAWTADDDGLDDVVITGEGRADGENTPEKFRFSTGGAEPGIGGGGGGPLMKEPLDGITMAVDGSVVVVVIAIGGGVPGTGGPVITVTDDGRSDNPTLMVGVDVGDD